MEKVEKSMEFNQLKSALQEMLTEQRYSSSGRWHYDDTFAKLKLFAETHGCSVYSAQIGEQFLAFARNKYPFSDDHWKNVKTAVRRFNDLAEGRGYVFHQPFSGNKIADCFVKISDEYSDYLRIRGKRESSVKLYAEYNIKFLNQLFETGLENISLIDAIQIYRVFEASPDKGNLATALRSFLRFVYDKKIIPVDYSGIIPSVRKRQPLPSTYSEDETKRLLSVIETSTPLGKRDLAVILIALRLGLRSGDIENLKFENIDFDRECMNFIQQKSGTAHKLVLLPEIAAALKDYIKSGRPQTECKNIFMIHRAPYRPISSDGIYGIVSKYFRLSGVSTENKKHGAHSLRMTLASSLVENDIPFEAVRKILGQENAESTKRYVLFKPEMLRKCALIVPMPTCLFAETLFSGRERV